MQSQAFSFQKVIGVQNLYRYSNGTFYARFIRGGKEIRRSLKTTDKTTAKRELAVLMGLRTDERAVTLAQLVERYKDSIPNMAEHTVKTKKSICEKIQREWPGGSDVLIRKILPSQIKSFIGRRATKASQSNAFLTEFRQMFALAQADKLLAESPAEAVNWQKRKQPIRPTPDAEGFAAIIADVRAQEFNADARDSGDFLEAMGLLGLGQAELWAIHRRDVDLKRGRISVYRRKTSTPFQIPIYPQARTLCTRLCKGKGPNERLFAIRDAKKSLAGACERLGFPNFTQRSLRRFFVTNALERGVDVQTVARWQGHRDTKLILQIYGDVRAPHMERMAQLMIAK
jgi:integrase